MAGQEKVSGCRIYELDGVGGQQKGSDPDSAKHPYYVVCSRRLAGWADSLSLGDVAPWQGGLVVGGFGTVWVVVFWSLVFPRLETVWYAQGTLGTFRVSLGRTGGGALEGGCVGKLMQAQLTAY